MTRFPVRDLAWILAALLACPQATAAGRPRDGVQDLLHHEASQAMADGQYLRAEHIYARLIELDPDDDHALREAGRAAFALGDLAYAERVLGRVETLQRGAPDPEIRYLRAQALVALGRVEEGNAELAEAERQLSPTPPDRQSTLWLARIYAMRGDVKLAEAMYRTRLSPDPLTAEYAEIMLYIVEAKILGTDWPGAEKVLRELLSHQPQHPRGQLTLAWVLEGNGKIEEELPIRAALAKQWTDHRQHVLGYARALERASDNAGALAMYREADRLGDGDGPGMERMKRRQSLELAAGVTVGEDLSGSMLGWSAGATLPFSAGLRVAVAAAGVTGTPVRPRGATVMPEGATSISIGAQLLYDRRGYLFAAGPTIRLPGVSDSVGFGGSAALRTPAGRPLALQVTAQVGQPWRETTATIKEGGVVDGAGVDAFASLFSGRVVASVSVQGRRFGLEAMAGQDAPHALQLFVAGGVDVVLWSRPERVARGQILDEEMRWATTLATGLVVSYRHYEIVSQDPFGARLVLVERSRIDEASATLRYVLDDAGAVGFELRGGIGPDTVRDVLASRAGGALLVSVTAGSRFTAAYDFASQIGVGPSGLRHTGWVSLHVDL